MIKICGTYVVIMCLSLSGMMLTWLLGPESLIWRGFVLAFFLCVALIPVMFLLTIYAPFRKIGGKK